MATIPLFAFWLWAREQCKSNTSSICRNTILLCVFYIQYKETEISCTVGQISSENAVAQMFTLVFIEIEAAICVYSAPY